MQDEDDGLPCPYCQSTNPCEHLLLSVDLTFREPSGGVLYEAFKKRWHSILDDGENAPDFQEDVSFEELIEEVEALSDYDLEFEIEGGPGMSSTYQAFYCESDKNIQQAVHSFAAP